MLVNFGSTHNCIDIDIVKQLNLFIYPTKNLSVKVVDGHQVNDTRRCHKISVQVQELEIQ